MIFGTVIYEVHSDYGGRTRDVAVALATFPLAIEFFFFTQKNNIRNPMPNPKVGIPAIIQ